MSTHGLSAAASLEAVRRHGGFTDVRLGALGGWDASLAPMIALRVRVRPMATGKHEMLFALARPPVSLDRYEMITGLSGAARRPAA